MKMREIMAASYNVILDRMTLTKIMLLEYFKPAAFEHLTISASKYRDGIIEELSNIEVDPQSTDTNTFKTFLEDDWGENWLKLKPSLSQVDLRGYLFFTRDSLRTPIKVTSLELSKEGLVVYKLLTSTKSKASIAQALSKRDMLPRFDKIEIAKSLSNDIVSSEKNGRIDSSIFRSLFEWTVANEDILSDTLIFLRAIESVKLGLEVVPYVADYINGEETPNPQVKEIIDSWRASNGKLDKAIQQSEGS